MVAEQRAQKQEEGRLADEARQTKRQCEQQMAELEGQMQDLLFFLKAQEEVSFRGGFVVAVAYVRWGMERDGGRGLFRGGIVVGIAGGWSKGPF